LIPGLEVEHLARIIRKDGIWKTVYGEFYYYYGLAYSFFWGSLPAYLYFFVMLFISFCSSYLINKLLIRYAYENLLYLQNRNKGILYDLFGKK
jgi:hypothetical protein